MTDVNQTAVEAAAKAHCDFFGGEGWWDTGLIADTKPKALEAMRVALAAMPASQTDQDKLINELAQAVIAYDDLLRSYSGPLSVLCAGDVASIDAAYDALIAQAKALLNRARAQGGEA